MLRLLPLLALSAAAIAQPHPETQPQSPQPARMQYACGPANRMFRTLSATSLYSDTTAGFDLGTLPHIDPKAKACTSDAAFFFSVPLPEGNYRVTVTLGGPQAAVTTVKAEARRLMLQSVATQPNASATRTFNVNVRVPEIQPSANLDGADAAGPANRVRLKPREIGNLNWDPKLTLEFNGQHPSLRSLTIEPIPPAAHIPTLYLAGDSTVVDQDIEPWGAWGQMLPRFFTQAVTVANHAESGETVKSFQSEQRFAKIFSLIRPGDYLFLQFNHNDQKINPRTGEAAVPLAEYQRLFTEYIARARAAGATPVLVTAMNRNNFDAAGHIINTLGDYPDAVRQLAAQQKVALIDLNAMSRTLFEAMGPEAALHAFMHYPANTFPNQPDPIADNTHFNTYGAYELARCVVHGIRAAHLPIAAFLAPDLPDFDPAHPDAPASIDLPQTPIQIKTNVMKVPQT